MKTFTFRGILLFIFLASQVRAQTSDKTLLLVIPKKYWSVETSVVWPIFPGIYKINFMRQVWEKNTFKGELGLSLNIQPPRHSETEGDFSEEFIGIIYRQFFWKGLHIYTENHFAYGRIQNWPADGKNYESYAMFHDFCAGYRFHLLKMQKVGLTITPIAGGGFTSYTNSTWPRPERPYWLVNLLVGMYF